MTKDLLIFGIINLLVTILSSAGGGGGGLVTTPTMVLLGLTPAQAIATAKFNSLGISLGASSRFYREKMTDTRTIIIFSIMGGIGAIIGSLTLVYFQEYSEALQKIMGITILFVGIPMMYVRKAGLKPRFPSVRTKALGFFLLGLVVILSTAVGSGVGSLYMIILIGFFGMTALVASATRRAVQLTMAIFGLAIFTIAGLVNYKFGLVGLATSLVGGYLGAHIAIKKGNKFVLNLFAIISAVLAIQLLFG